MCLHQIYVYYNIKIKKKWNILANTTIAFVRHCFQNLTNYGKIGKNCQTPLKISVPVRYSRINVSPPRKKKRKVRSRTLVRPVFNSTWPIKTYSAYDRSCFQSCVKATSPLVGYFPFPLNCSFTFEPSRGRGLDLSF